MANPQTIAFCQLLGIENKINANIPKHVVVAPASVPMESTPITQSNPDEIPLDDLSSDDENENPQEVATSEEQSQQQQQGEGQEDKKVNNPNAATTAAAAEEQEEEGHSPKKQKIDGSS